MNYKQLETMRQTRLMLTEVVVPVITAGTLLLSNNEIRHNIERGARKAKWSVHKKWNAFKEKER